MVFRILSIAVLLCMFLASPSRSQLLNLESTESRSLASSNLTRSKVGALSINPALDQADSIRNFRLSLAFTPNEQGLQDAYSAAAEAVYYSPDVDLSFSIGASDKTFSDSYSEIDGLLGLTKVFQLSGGRTASVGTRFRYETTSFTSQYQPLHSYLFDLGFSFDIGQEFAIGGSIANLFGSGYSLTSGIDEPRPRLFLIGASYRPLELGLGIHTAIEEEESAGLSLHIGADYTLIEYLVLRAGVTTDTGTISAGAGLIYDPLAIDIAARFDKTFGMIATFGISGRW
jgi:hypothetical protein